MLCREVLAVCSEIHTEHIQWTLLERRGRDWKTSAFITEECNGKGISEELIGTTEYLT